MTIYKMNYKKLRKEMTKFSKTIYGKITFILSYSVPIILTALLVVMTISLEYINNLYLTVFTFGIVYLLLFLILITFILGTIYFYHELKEFIKETKS